MKADEQQIILIEDTREQDGWGEYFKTPHVVGTLTAGDYSVLGLEELISIERKSLSDLLASLTGGRQRFESELKKARRYHRFFVIVECRISSLLVEDFGRLSRAHPRSIWGTISTWSTRYHPFIFANDRVTGPVFAKAFCLPTPRSFSRRPPVWNVRRERH